MSKPGLQVLLVPGRPGLRYIGARGNPRLVGEFSGNILKEFNRSSWEPWAGVSSSLERLCGFNLFLRRLGGCYAPPGPAQSMRGMWVCVMNHDVPVKNPSLLETQVFGANSRPLVINLVNFPTAPWKMTRAKLNKIFIYRAMFYLDRIYTFWNSTPFLAFLVPWFLFMLHSFWRRELSIKDAFPILYARPRRCCRKYILLPIYTHVLDPRWFWK